MTCIECYHNIDSVCNITDNAIVDASENTCKHMCKQQCRYCTFWDSTKHMCLTHEIVQEYYDSCGRFYPREVPDEHNS